MIHKLRFAISTAMHQENEVLRAAYCNVPANEFAARYPTAEDFCAEYASSPDGSQMRDALQSIAPGSRILDIGAARGVTSIYLTTLGYRVAAAEPCYELCEYIKNAASLYGRPITVYNVSGECLDQMPERDFDVCLFHASLHHCDDPIRALANCHDLLAPGGRILLLNEPLLQFHRSKAWFERQLSEGTLVTGHYGGNEHIYYFREYLAMLQQAGFSGIRSFPMHRYVQPDQYLKTISAASGGRASVGLRRMYYRVISRLCRSGFLGRPWLWALKRLSLVQSNFVGIKPTAA